MSTVIEYAIEELPQVLRLIFRCELLFVPCPEVKWFHYHLCQDIFNFVTRQSGCRVYTMGSLTTLQVLQGVHQKPDSSGPVQFYKEVD